MSLERPNPPVVGKVTHFNITLEWMHVKEYLPPKKRYRFKLQESSYHQKFEWTTVYTGYGFCTTIGGLEAATEYNYRLCFNSPDNVRSEYSVPVKVRTTSKSSIDNIHHVTFY